MNTTSKISNTITAAPAVKTISFVIPMKNEEESLRELFDGIATQMAKLKSHFEVIFIDDGSTDGSWQVVQALAEEHPENIRAIRFRTNIGKAGALAAGFRAARGSIVFTMDADLQDDPNEIPRFLAKLDEGYDLVSGFKQKRHDPWHKVLPSRVFNRMLSRMTGVYLHDHNCGFKCYRAEVVKSVLMYGEMHRMVPALSIIQGFKSAEIVVQHHARRFGVSKYGVRRFLRGFMDMLTVSFLKNYRERPLHLMGGLALSALLVAGLFAVAGFALPLAAGAKAWLLNAAPVIAMIGLPLMAIGLLSELILHRSTTTDRGLPVAEELFPALEKGPAASKIVQLPGMPATSVKPVALIVDDDYNVRSLLEFQLRADGWETICATDGIEAIQEANSFIDVILLDVDMPGRNGVSSMDEILRRSPGAKVIMVSGTTRVDMAVQAMKQGAFDFIRKPFNPAEVVSKARLALTMSQLDRQRLRATA